MSSLLPLIILGGVALAVASRDSSSKRLKSRGQNFVLASTGADYQRLRHGIFERWPAGVSVASRPEVWDKSVVTVRSLSKINPNIRFFMYPFDLAEGLHRPSHSDMVYVRSLSRDARKVIVFREAYISNPQQIASTVLSQLDELSERINKRLTINVGGQAYNMLKKMSSLTGAHNMDPDNRPIEDILLEIQLTFDIHPADGSWNEATYDAISKIIKDHS